MAARLDHGKLKINIAWRGDDDGGVVIMIVAVAFMIALFDGAVSKYFTIYDTALWGVFICKNGETDFQIL